MLEVMGLHKSFGGNRVLKGVSFSVEEGEMVGVVGPNGSGKTTLINIISGVLKQDRGRVLLGGTPLDGLPPHRRARLGVGRTFQITRLFGNLSVLENVLVPIRFGSPLQATERIAEEILDLVGLLELREKPASSLSLAQRKRLELARALALRPRLLLLDEVFAGLNPPAVAEIVSLLRKLNAERGITMILVEHVLRALFQLTRRVLVLSGGVLIFDGKPEDMGKSDEVVRAYLGERYRRVR
jgi:branched-chain amino acid transport system ATP-binding protein